MKMTYIDFLLCRVLANETLLLIDITEVVGAKHVIRRQTYCNQKALFQKHTKTEQKWNLELHLTKTLELSFMD